MPTGSTFESGAGMSLEMFQKAPIVCDKALNKQGVESYEEVKSNYQSQKLTNNRR